MTSPKVKSVNLVNQNQVKIRKIVKNREKEEQESELLGYSSDSMMTGGEIVLMSLYDRSKKLQSQTLKKGLKVDCLSLSPRSPLLQPPRLAATKKRTEGFKSQLSNLGKSLGVHFHWTQSHSDPAEQLSLASKLAHISHKITQETLRVLGNR